MAQTESIETTEYSFTAVFEPAEEGGYVVTFPAIPGLVTEGDTLEEARAMAADALQGYLEILQEDGRPLPAEREHERNPVRERVTARLRTA
ncbi:MAG: type II toxin-antitoxin system HicB family antitoxin [Proteobacteria bacterium]|nr:type II toxin-antitoxin system HicB family antitoxin [Pseudomonadota bacterium]